MYNQIITTKRVLFFNLNLIMFKAIFRFMNVQPSESPISPQMRVDEIFKQMDTNHDFKISRDEFIKCLLNDEFLRYLLAPV